MTKTTNDPALSRRTEAAVDEIRKALTDLRFGTITVIVQDGIVVQIDTTTKNRMDYSSLDEVAGGEGI